VSLSTIEVRPFRLLRQVLSLRGEILAVPEGWDLLPPGDPALSRRIKEDGPTWTIALAIVKRNTPIEATLSVDGVPAAQQVIV
jgi:hypothetical protein